MKNIIWCLESQDEIDFSRDWLKEILGFEKEYFLIPDFKYNIFTDNSFIVFSSEKKSEKFETYLQEWNNKGLNYSVVHLSDEAYSHNYDFYRIAKKVIRNYYHAKYLNPNRNVKFFPLGYKSGLKPVIRERNFKYNFVGQLKSDRYEMKSCFDGSGTFYRFTQKWNDNVFGMNILEYSEVLSSSIFTLCPRGWVNLDSFRICEALECGSIPIVVLDNDGSDYYQNIFPNHPFIISSSWKENYEIAENMDPEEIFNKQLETKNYWDDLKGSLKLSIGEYLKCKI
jgi:hypothetical protein